MKKLIALLFGTFIAAQSLMAQTPAIVNPGFENGWRTINIANVPPFTTEGVDNWNCVDSILGDPLVGIAAQLAGITLTPKQQIYKSTDAHSDSFALEVRTEYISDTIILPGIVASAAININLSGLGGGGMEDIFSYSNGLPGYGKKIDTVRAWVKLDTTNVDDALITVTAFQVRDGESMEIGAGATTISKDTIYQHIAIGVAYLESNNTATDTFIVTIFSSVFDANGTLTEGNTLLVDDFSVEFSEGERAVSVEKIKLVNDMVLVYPVPAKNELHFDLNKNVNTKDLQLTIYDLNGRVIESQKINNTSFVKDITHYTSGNYIYSIRNNANNTAQNGKFIVE